MRVLLVVAHPEPQSFNGAMRDVAVATLASAGHAVDVHDLYASAFNPVAGPGDVTQRADPQKFDLGREQFHASANGLLAGDIRTEIERLRAADLLILQFPLWWYSVPAILKGWIDRVFAYGSIYAPGKTWDNGMMRGKRAMLAITTSAPAETFLPDGKNGDLERMLWPLHAGVFGVCGYQVLPPFVAHAVAYITPEARARILADYAGRLRGVLEDKPLYFHPLEDYGPDRRLRPDVEPRTPAQHRGPRRHW
ncbi:MAG: NAD(P)H-dependent oxidoreductase [Gammaproteobacteria bacterium]|nr:NAD(P)H-dependent oxidoreductase [Gammaproteobacteria bacterium]